MRAARKVALASGVVGVLSAFTLPISAAGASPMPPELASVVTPLDPQRWENPDHMRWSDYRAVPATSWADVDREPQIRRFDVALVLGDFTDQPFLVTQQPRSHPFGNPQPKASNIPRAEVAQFYEDFLTVPSTLNHGHTVNEYWMEDTFGEYGVELTAFGVYGLPGKMHEYGLNDVGQFGAGCPSGDRCNKDIRGDLGDAWVDDVGQGVVDGFDLVYYLTAGHDESGTWQEFGEMRFASREDVPDEFGPPDASMPNWIQTRYVPWTSWLAGAGQWPNAGGGSSTQSESSGAAVYAHELSHLFGIGDNYNNPYGVPLSRSYSGPWDMMSRGSFNGPFGPHQRWVVPATKGATMGSQHTFRNKLKLDVLSDDQFVELSRSGIEQSGVVFAEVTAREVPVGAAFGRPGVVGVNIALDDGGDLSAPCNVEDDYLCDQGNYDNYTVEVVDRMGSDSFTPDSGVLLAKTKDVDFAPFVWVIDANPQDIDLVDFVRPDGTEAKVSLGDYRQLSDALFKAGSGSGSEYEYVDRANRLHFYVLDLSRDAEGVLRYVIAVRSLDGSGPHDRGVSSGDGASEVVQPAVAVKCTFPVTNSGSAGATAQRDAGEGYVNADVFRLSATASDGWRAWLPRAVVGIRNGETMDVDVYAGRGRGGAAETTLTLKAVSESDRTARAISTCSAPSA